MSTRVRECGSAEHSLTEEGAGLPASPPSPLASPADTAPLSRTGLLVVTMTRSGMRTLCSEVTLLRCRAVKGPAVASPHLHPCVRCAYAMCLPGVPSLQAPRVLKAPHRAHPYFPPFPGWSGSQGHPGLLILLVGKQVQKAKRPAQGWLWHF